MTTSADVSVPIKHTDRFFIGGEWVTPSSDSTITVIDSHTEQAYLTVAEAQAADIDRAVTAAREAFDHGPWTRLSPAERAAYLRAIGAEIRRRTADIVAMWPRESGVTVGLASTGGPGAQHIFNYYAGLADTFEWERPVKSPRGFGLVVKEPVGAVGAIVPWNTPMALISMKVAPALIAGQMRTGNIGHNGFKTDFEMGFGGFKQSGIGREGGELGLMLFLESKAILLDGPTSRYRDTPW
jgi:aldehyde dehydrogenase (NAD+)